MTDSDLDAMSVGSASPIGRARERFAPFKRHEARMPDGPIAAVSLGMMALLCASCESKMGRSVCELPDSSPGSSPAPAPPAGSGTDVEVDYSACDSSSTEVDAASARRLGFNVDADLALLSRGANTSFHRGECIGVPTLDGQLTIAIQPQSIAIVHLAPNGHDPPMYSCPADYVVYHSTVELSASDRSISGTIELDFGPWSNGLYAQGVADARAFGGTLSVRVDESRPHQETLSIQLGIQEKGPSGMLFTSTQYADATGDQGEGEFWPASDTSQCASLGELPASSSTVMTLDQYKASCAM